MKLDEIAQHHLITRYQGFRKHLDANNAAQETDPKVLVGHAKRFLGPSGSELTATQLVNYHLEQGDATRKVA